MKQANFSNQQIAISHNGRFDIYAIIHKALRRFMSDTLNAVGSMDGNDAQEVADGLAQLRALTAFCFSHLQHENAFVHAAMEQRRPGSTTAIAAEHTHHEWALGQLEALAVAVEQSDGAARSAAIAQLYRSLALFVAENLAHMNIEETEHNAVLWATHSDTEIIAIEQALVASIPPAESLATMRWMIPAMNATERAEKLAAIRRDAPAAAFDALLGVARTNLSERDWRKLADALGLSEKMAA